MRPPDSIRSVLAARLGSMKHSSEAERIAFGNTSAIGKIHTTFVDDHVNRERELEMRFPRFPHAHHPVPPVPGPQTTQAKPADPSCRSPPLRRPQIPGLRTAGIATREFSDFCTSYETLHSLHQGTYGSVSAAIDKVVRCEFSKED